jgi:hypothetical protein
MTKDKKFQMRCTQQFLDDLDSLSNEMGLSRAATIELTISIYPALIRTMNKHESMLAKLKEEIQ